MIEINNLCKGFGDIQAVSGVTMEIKQGCVFGLVGTNGAGKSTLLRMLAGIIQPDEGSIRIGGQPVYEHAEIKREIFYISDDAFFFPNSKPVDMMQYYSHIYENFDRDQFLSMLRKFGLDANRRINTFSKGMKKQLSVLLGVCANTRYLLCDETFDGLDPVMRQAVKSIFASEIINREFTPIIASHNLRELEDICDYIGLLHEGGILLSEDLEDMKFHIHKLQCVLPEEALEMELLREMDVLHYEKSGSLLLVTARGTKTEILDCVARRNPIFSEVIPLTLEEIFISETEVAGYEVKNILL
ncbi:MAG: ABC transporter ATP-binding protein [Lachnospiraceae bacterium]|nr:ABC transporter ATP-binding protein [Lachnospiraceae bacterium]